MAHMSGTHKDGSQQSHGSTSYNGNSVHGMESAIPTFQHQQTISMDWTPEEQAILEEGLAKYASESSIIRYAKIAVQLKNKTVRDVALRYRWMTKKETSKRRKEDLNATRKSKDKKEKFVDPLAKPSHLGARPSLLHASGMINNNNGINAVTRELLQQNSWAFEQISANLNTHQLHENLHLLSKARENLFRILNNLDNMTPTMKKMPPLPRLNEELANSILPPLNSLDATIIQPSKKVDYYLPT
ncbi:Myb-like DNA-binding domain [Olea europaea subsp. europaea]|uniref:Myb-like DNA-binding domain n=1 Tax=Olea europaea subsp. europaea TaxID=158383 RepID=A0A8S0V6D1_OLEEU|nr:Myb-like DNA-binding domain [Olea europaea subsp. europaea]